MIADNLDNVRQNIRVAAEQCGRKPDEIRLVAVSKTYPTSAIKEAIGSAQFLFGENYIQEATQKYTELKDSAEFHFIGHLQTNKAKIAAEIFKMIETVDSMKLGLHLNRHLIQYDKTMDILIQVNIGNDKNKAGITPADAEDLIREISQLSNLRVRGLMTMPPFFEESEKVRPYFRKLRILAETLRKKNLFFDNSHVEISMGMSGDYQIAIEEGATLVRVGTAIFGSRS